MTKETIPDAIHRNETVEFSVKTTNVKEVINPSDIIKVLESDFIERKEHEKKPMSHEDKKFLDILKEGIHVRKDCHLEMPLPFKEPHPRLPNNRKQAETRLLQLKRRLRQNEKFRKDYTEFMSEIIRKGYAEEVPTDKEAVEGRVFYIPHHGVYHPRKPEQIRVVFDCSSKHQDVSLNDVLLQGPDMTNDLIAVLCRFRKEPVAIACDVQKMFYQFHVNEEDRDYLRFLWWDKGDITTTPKEYRMTVHLFGAISSPACANFGLKQTAEDGRNDFGDTASEFLRNEFYVDDGLTSVPSASEAIELIQSTKGLCQNRGIKLHKFVSNNDKVIAAIPVEDRAKSVSSINLGRDEIHVERVLGVQWSIDLDCLPIQNSA